MAASDILVPTQAKTAFTLTLNSLANNAGRQTTMISNASTKYPGAICHIAIKMGTTPTANSVINFYLLRGDDPAASTFRTDNAGASDAALTPVNATLIASMLISAASTGTIYYLDFDTAVAGILGPEWGILVENRSGAALDASAAKTLAQYEYYNFQNQ